jgi:hypothetical protein
MIYTHDGTGLDALGIHTLGGADLDALRIHTHDGTDLDALRIHTLDGPPTGEGKLSPGRQLAVWPTWPPQKHGG